MNKLDISTVIITLLLFLSLIYFSFKFRQYMVKSIKYNVNSPIFSDFNKVNIDKYLKINSLSHSDLLIQSDLDNFNVKCVTESDFKFIEQNTELKLTFYEKDIISKGYYFSRHKIVTEDGYVNTIWRISKKCETEENSNLLPVIINHGLLDNSYTFLQLDKSLPYLLADQGYEVWLCNNRGSTFSSEHLKLDSYDISSDYWDFTFIEIAKYDLKSNIDFVLNFSSSKKVHFIGHSQGGFQLMISFILDNSYFNKKIVTYTAFGTVPKFIIIVSNL